MQILGYSTIGRSSHPYTPFLTAESDRFFECIPETECPYDSRYKELLSAVNRLPEKYRTILVMRYFNDYSEEDTAKLVGIPKGTVKSRLNKAKKLIREVMEGEENYV